MAGAQGLLLTLIGTESSVSGGNSMAPMALIDPSLQPTTIEPAGGCDRDWSTPAARPPTRSPLPCSSRRRASAAAARRTSARDPHGALHRNAGTREPIYSDPASDGATQEPGALRLREVGQHRRCLRQSGGARSDPGPADHRRRHADLHGHRLPGWRRPEDRHRHEAGAHGYAGAGTIAMGGYDYHDSTRATGEMRNFKAGQMIGAVLEYAQRKRYAGDDLRVQRRLAELHRHARQQRRRPRQARLAG